MERDDRSRPRMGYLPLAFWLRKAGACRSGLISRSRRRLRLGVSICVRSDILSKRMTRPSAFAVSMDLPLGELDVHLNGFGWEDS